MLTTLTCKSRAVRGLRAAGAVLATVMAIGAGGAQAAVPEAVSINTSGTIFAPTIRVEPHSSPAVASLLILSGSDGMLTLDGAGRSTTNTGDTLVRSANEFLRRGFNVMLADVAPGFPSGVSVNDRLSATHATHLQSFLNAAAARWNLPVWVVAFGGATASAITIGGIVPPMTNYQGIILVGPTSDYSLTTPAITTPNATLYASRIASVTKPTFGVWYGNDPCPSSTPAGMASLLASIPAAVKSTQTFTGGHRVAVQNCSALGFHGFSGIETRPINAINSFILVNNASAPALGAGLSDGSGIRQLPADAISSGAVWAPAASSGMTGAIASDRNRPTAPGAEAVFFGQATPPSR